MFVHARIAGLVPGVMIPGVMTMAEECYRVATKVLPKVDEAIAKATDGKTPNVATASAARSLLARPTSDLTRKLFAQRAKLLPTADAPTTRKAS